MKKNDIIDFVLDNGTSTLIKALENLEKYDNLELLDTSVPHSVLLTTIESGKIPYFHENEKLFYSLYTHPPILQRLRDYVTQYRETNDDWVLKEMWHWLLYGMEGEKVFGTAFFSDFFEQIPKLPKYPFSKQLLKELNYDMGIPKYLLV